MSDLARATAFYDAALASLGYVRVWTGPSGAGYGLAGSDEKLAVKERAGASAPGAGFHLAITAPTRASVDEFFEQALRVGGTADGEPVLRPQYGAGYYAAFVVDPDGYRIEAVCHEPAVAVADGRAPVDDASAPTCVSAPSVTS